MDRLTFKGGWWADVRTEWPYGADAKVASAYAFTDDAASFEQACRVMLQQSVPAAHVPDLDGGAVVFGPDMWETVDGRIGRAVLRRCQKNWAAWSDSADPNDTEEPSPA